MWRQATPCSSAQLSYSRHHQQGRTGVALCGVSQSLSFAKIYLVLSVYQVFLFLKAWPRETEEKEKNLVKSSFDLSNQELQCLETKPRADKIVIIFKNLSNCSVLFRFLRILRLVFFRQAGSAGKKKLVKSLGAKSFDAGTNSVNFCLFMEFILLQKVSIVVPTSL